MLNLTHLGQWHEYAGSDKGEEELERKKMFALWAVWVFLFTDARGSTACLLLKPCPAGRSQPGEVELTSWLCCPISLLLSASPPAFLAPFSVCHVRLIEIRFAFLIARLEG